MKGFENMTVRFYLYKEATEAQVASGEYDEGEYDIFEVDEAEFLEPEHERKEIEYMRCTVFEHGVKQICLTKM